MCKALRGTELNSGSVQVKYVLIYSMQQNENVFSEKSDCNCHQYCCLGFKDSGRAFEGVPFLGNTKATECSEDGFNFGCPE